MRGLFVTGTDTGAGKTVVAASVAAALSARGERVAAFKPVLTGTDDAPDPDWPPDDALLALAAGGDAAAVVPERFGPPVSPHLAAELAGRTLDPAGLAAAARDAAAEADVLVAEGVGGLLVPLTPEYSVRDLARDLALPLVIAARPGLGTINHTLLTVEAARTAAIGVAGIVLTPWPGTPGTMELSNRETIAQATGLPVSALPAMPRAQRDALAGAGRGLPLDAWLATPASS